MSKIANVFFFACTFVFIIIIIINIINKKQTNESFRIKETFNKQFKSI
jgi:hypothetical protein